MTCLVSVEIPQSLSVLLVYHLRSMVGHETARSSSGLLSGMDEIVLGEKRSVCPPQCLAEIAPDPEAKVSARDAWGLFLGQSE